MDHGSVRFHVVVVFHATLSFVLISPNNILFFPFHKIPYAKAIVFGFGATTLLPDGVYNDPRQALESITRCVVSEVI